MLASTAAQKRTSSAARQRPRNVSDALANTLPGVDRDLHRISPRSTADASRKVAIAHSAPIELTSPTTWREYPGVCGRSRRQRRLLLLLLLDTAEHRRRTRRSKPEGSAGGSAGSLQRQRAERNLRAALPASARARAKRPGGADRGGACRCTSTCSRTRAMSTPPGKRTASASNSRPGAVSGRLSRASSARSTATCRRRTCGSKQALRGRASDGSRWRAARRATPVSTASWSARDISASSSKATRGFTVLPRWNDRPGYHQLGAAEDTLLIYQPAAPMRGNYWLTGGARRLPDAARFGQPLLSRRTSDRRASIAEISGSTWARSPFDEASLGASAVLELDSGRFASARALAGCNTASADRHGRGSFAHRAGAALVAAIRALGVFDRRLRRSWRHAHGQGPALAAVRHERLHRSLSRHRSGRARRGWPRVSPLGEDYPTLLRVAYSRVIAPKNGYQALRVSLSRKLSSSSLVDLGGVRLFLRRAGRGLQNLVGVRRNRVLSSHRPARNHVDRVRSSVAVRRASTRKPCCAPPIISTRRPGRGNADEPAVPCSHTLDRGSAGGVGCLPQRVRAAALSASAASGGHRLRRARQARVLELRELSRHGHA